MNTKLRVLHYVFNVVDLVFFSISYLLAYVVRFSLLRDGIVSGDYMQLYFVMLILYFIIIVMVSDVTKLPDGQFRTYFMRCVQSHFYLGLFLFAFLFAMKAGIEYSRLHIFMVLGISFLLATVLGYYIRKQIMGYVKRAGIGERVILVTRKDSVAEVLEDITRQDIWHYHVVGIVITDVDMKGQYMNRIPVIAGSQDILQEISRAEADSVFIYEERDSNVHYSDLICELQNMGVTSHVFIQESVLANGYHTYNQFGDYSVVTYGEENGNLGAELVIRVLDFLMGVVGSVFCLAMGLVVAIVTACTTKGPVWLKYNRVGKNGKRFSIYRFCTVRLFENNGIAEVETTVLGKFLEYTGLQNMPMCFALLMGDMSLMGKQALSLGEFLEYSPVQRKNMCTKPGLFASWKITCYKEEQVQLLEHWSLEHENILKSVEQKQISVDEMSMTRKLYHIGKRFVDILVSAICLVVLSPLFLVISLLIIYFDGHSPIYSHLRVGLNGKMICIYKFRSMHYHASDLHAILTPEQLEQYKKEFKLKDDPRVTGIGKFLRRTSLDELPQLWNILKGDLSLIGPRPIVEKETENYGDKVAELLSVKPGLTGYWQAYERNDATYETGKRQEMELYYVEHENMWLDIKIIFKTIQTVCSGKGNI